MRMLSLPLPWAALLMLAAVGSLAGNLLQWRAAAVAAAECRARLRAAQDAGALAVANLVRDQSAAISVMRAEHDLELIALREANRHRQAERIVIYRDRAPRADSPACHVTLRQVDAVNEGLR